MDVRYHAFKTIPTDDTYVVFDIEMLPIIRKNVFDYIVEDYIIKHGFRHILDNSELYELIHIEDGKLYIGDYVITIEYGKYEQKLWTNFMTKDDLKHSTNTASQGVIISPKNGSISLRQLDTISYFTERVAYLYLDSAFSMSKLDFLSKEKRDALIAFDKYEYQEYKDAQDMMISDDDLKELDF